MSTSAAPRRATSRASWRSPPRTTGAGSPRWATSAAVDGWHPFRLLTNRPLTLPGSGETLPAEFHDTGALPAGPMDPAADGYDSRHLWRVEGDVLTLRVPWAMAGLADPSSRQALVVGADGPGTLEVDGVGVSVGVGGRSVALSRATWEPWNRVHHHERAEDGIEQVGAAMRETSAPR